MNREINGLIEQGVTIVTPTNRLSRFLKDQYAALQIKQGKRSWLTPDIIAWSFWCRRLWDECLHVLEEDKVILNQVQQQLLWQQVVQSSQQARNLLQTHATAIQAMQSYNLCMNWRIPVFPDGVYLNEDARAFRQWVTAYEDKLQKNHWCDEAGLIDHLIELIENKEFSEHRLAFYGFDEWLPQQWALVEAMKSANGHVVVINNDDQNEACVYAGFLDRRNEILAAAQWARQCLLDGPDRRVGIVVPGLRQQRNQIEHLFEQVLATENRLQAASSQRPFSISLGQPLAQFPMIHTALSLLGMAYGRISLEDFSALLRSPFIKGYQTESQSRALFDARLRRFGEQEFRLKTIFRFAEQQNESHTCEDFLGLMREFQDHLQQLPDKQTPADWAKTFSEVLNIFGWPGERNLNSDEYQTLNAWKKALDQLVSLDFISRPMAYAAALAQLRRITNDTSFQPETGEAPIQILSTAGASAMQFDHLWVMGLHDQVWPGSVMGHPFIPIKLQRQAGIPNASAEEQLQYTRTLTQQLIQSANNVVLSYPMNDGDRVLRPSPLLKEFAEQAIPDSFNLSMDYYAEVFASAQTEQFVDSKARAIAKGESVSGGAALFKDQAACPFRAFARHRLYAEGLSSTDIGLDAADRGLLIHRTLQLFWQRLKHSKQLHNTSEDVLNEMINDAVSKAIQQHAHRLPETFTERFTQLEQQRLMALLKAWLTIEQQRQPFTVKATEKGHHAIFSDITLNMRLDRVDELSDGRLVIIDYKTGQVSVNDWEGERPNDPQLPLYAVTSEGDIAALVFASLKTGDLKFVGLAESEGLLPNVKEDWQQDWPQKLKNWETVLTNLAKQFRTGDASVAPKDGQACRYCELHAFCRIHEKAETLQEEMIDE